MPEIRKISFSRGEITEIAEIAFFTFSEIGIIAEIAEIARITFWIIEEISFLHFILSSAFSWNYRNNSYNSV